MRRPLLIILIIIIGVSFLYTNSKSINTSYEQQFVTIEGLVKQKVLKQKYNEYRVGKFIVRDYSKKININVGQVINLNGKFNSLDNMDYDDFNYGRYIKSIGYKGIIYIKNYEIVGNNILYNKLYKIKDKIRNTNRYLYKKNSDFINSLLIGEKEELSYKEKSIFSRTGTSHVIAISGLHTGILCSIVVFAMRGVNRPFKAVILFILISIYSIMVGVPPSIVRSIAFIIFLYISIFMDRKYDSISILSLVGCTLIINNQYIIYNVSFQLSFLSTLSIIYFYGYINDIIKIKLISLTISANILTLPIIYYNFNGIPMLSIISNCVIVPFIGILIYIDIISLIVFNIDINIAKILAKANIIIINLIYYLLEAISKMEFAYIDIENPNILYVILYYIAVFSYMVYKELKVMKEQENELQGYYEKY